VRSPPKRINARTVWDRLRAARTKKLADSPAATISALSFRPGHIVELTLAVALIQACDLLASVDRLAAGCRLA
jgi:hypothetical protein